MNLVAIDNDNVYLHIIGNPEINPNIQQVQTMNNVHNDVNRRYLEIMSGFVCFKLSVSCLRFFSSERNMVWC